MIVPNAASLQWLWSPQDLANSPSVLEGMPVEIELFLRAYSIQVLFNVCESVERLALHAHLFGAVFLHRFYMRNSFQRYSPRVRTDYLINNS